MTLVAVPGPESRSVTHRDWRTLLRNSANNMLTRPPYDVPRANLADSEDANGQAAKTDWAEDKGSVLTFDTS
jgi:hypothetical protein